ncbi:MAG: polysaccharide biosynthesis/export family protein, partial [Candidatus Aminicenantes bacterium]|nr:polysaccharide biosynthesis/export family protein [Candidatus Aminicenantes bacterium]
MNDISYTIGPGDLIDIKVFNVPELNITVRVSGNGTITLPLIGNIKAEGFSRSQLEKQLATKLEKRYL